MGGATRIARAVPGFSQNPETDGSSFTLVNSVLSLSQMVLRAMSHARKVGISDKWFL